MAVVLDGTTNVVLVQSQPRACDVPAQEDGHAVVMDVEAAPGWARRA